MNLSDSVGFFGEASSKIINTSLIGEIKIEIIFSSQVANCILGASVPINTPVFAQLASELDTPFTNANTLVTGSADAAINDKNFRRSNVQKYTNNSTIGDSGIPIVGNSDATFSKHIC
jgi:hypothetical protein